MFLGAIAAISQKNIKRLLAYSSIGHVGYALAGLATGTNDGIQSSVIYITIYILMNLGLFSCLLISFVFFVFLKNLINSNVMIYLQTPCH